MIQRKREAGFEISISARDDGTLEAMYITLSGDRVARTKEIIEDILLADYNAKGNLVGIEVLAPVKLSRITPLVDPSIRAPLRRFVREQAPRELLLA